ncbi:sensor histidine kinase [Solibacillus daqui]|uniref:sensor histidine kinase n=1 Tax=Solibacillus daqui TaxID=2912187 RepID=UPI0023650C80|nr:sensor histidine kinase [Solibacillus daqui]
MKRISTKLAVYFFLTVFVMQLLLMYYLHHSMITSKVNEEYERLLANGSNHRDVLVENYSESTVHHIVLMEMDSNRQVIITDRDGKVIKSSENDAQKLSNFMPVLPTTFLKQDTLLVSDWKNAPYIISVHPFHIQTNDEKGYVVMLQSTRPIEQLVNQLNFHFGIAGITSVLVLLIAYFVLSKILTRPLIRMKEATEKINAGDFQVELPKLKQDELGELSQAIQMLARDLERLKKERNEFLAAIAHELSTPLTYLIGYTKVAMRPEIREDERNQYLRILVEESERMKELVKNLVDLAKMDENSFTISKENFGAKAYFQQLINLVHPSFTLKDLELTFICNKDVQIYADPLRLEQIILNLLDNAKKYSPSYTQVTLSVSTEHNKTIISITDQGIGIPPVEIGYIFEKLYRVEKSRSRSLGGSGIGLAVVKELVEAHGGTIDVKSTLGKGSTFTITLKGEVAE